MSDRENSLGPAIRELRRARDLTQAELAELAGVGPRFLSELERGKPSVRVSAVNAVLAVFGKTLGIVDQTREFEDDWA